MCDDSKTISKTEENRKLATENMSQIDLFSVDIGFSLA